MNPIETLKAEHRGIETALAVLERVAARLEARVDARTIRDAGALIDFFRTFADTCHHAKEETVLFPLLEEMGVSRQGGPIGVMLHEHDLGRAHVRGMDQALGAQVDASPGAARGFRRHAEGYVGLLRQHIQKEDFVLFEIATQRLDPGRKDRAAAEFERIERDVVGAGRHERYHALLEELAVRYLRPAEGATAAAA